VAHKQTIILTRTKEEAGAWGQALRKAGYSAKFLPVQTYAPVEPPALNIAHFHLILFTSKHAVAFLKEAFPHATQYKISCAAVGRATAKAAEEAGFKVDLVAEQEKAEGLARIVARQYAAKAKVLLPCSAIAREELPRIMKKAGFSVTVAPLYEPVPMNSPDDLDVLLKEAGTILFFAPSQVRTFLTWVEEPPAHLKYWALGATTLKAIPAALHPRSLETPDVDEFIKLLKA
jgi:uroporphyrinogen-III synthase